MSVNRPIQPALDAALALSVTVFLVCVRAPEPERNQKTLSARFDSVGYLSNVVPAVFGRITVKWLPTSRLFRCYES